MPRHRLALGRNIPTHRKLAKLTQEKLAERAGLSVVFLSLLENGHRSASFDSLLQIAKALKVRIEDLVRGVE